jgi:hypothetical protein
MFAICSFWEKGTVLFPRPLAGFDTGQWLVLVRTIVSAIGAINGVDTMVVNGYTIAMTDDTANEAVVALRLRLRAIENEISDLQRQQQAIGAQSHRLHMLQRSLQETLDREEELLTPLDPNAIPEMHPTGGENLSDLLLEALKTGPKSLDDLKKIGANWQPLQKSNFPGRALNFALVGLQKGNHVDRMKSGHWRLVPEETRK